MTCRELEIAAVEQPLETVVAITARRAHRVDVAEDDKQAAFQRRFAARDIRHEHRQDFDRRGFLAMDSRRCHYALQYLALCALWFKAHDAIAEPSPLHARRQPAFSQRGLFSIDDNAEKAREHGRS